MTSARTEIPLSTRSRLPADAAHPDRARWQRAVDAATERGMLVADLLASALPLAHARVLDCGCGAGGTSAALRMRGARVVAFDVHAVRLAMTRARDGGLALCGGDAGALPFARGVFDAVVLQDVLEHVEDPARVLAECARVVRGGGVVYVSTPNRWSPATVASDPHFALPLAGVLPRAGLRRVLRRLRPTEAARRDLPLLLSFSSLERLARGAGFRLALCNRAVARMLRTHPARVVWSAPHLALVGVLERLGMLRLVELGASDGRGVRTRWLAPAWHCLLHREAR